MIFIDNKYTKWYNSIISNAQARILSKETYTEKHHLIPKSFGGSNSKENLVKLTAREHFVCHWLLTKMLNGTHKAKMIYALARFMYSINHNRYKITSRKYELLKSIPRLHTDEVKAKMRISAKTRPKPTAETIEKRVAQMRGRISPIRGKSTQNKESKNRIGAAQKELLSKLTAEEKFNRMKKSCSSPESWTDERRANMSKGMLGKKRVNTEKIGRANKGKTWKLINNKRVWIAKEN